VSRPNFQAFYPNFFKFLLVFSKFYQTFLWRFWGISKG
jgi:hypothetical protein